MYRTKLYHQVSSKSIFSFLLIMETYSAPLIGLGELKRFRANLVDFEQEALTLSSHHLWYFQITSYVLCSFSRMLSCFISSIHN